MSIERKPGAVRGQRWAVPATGLAIGVGYVAIFLARDDPEMAVAGFVIMAAYVLVLVVVSRRSEAVALLRGETTDERRSAIQQRASAFTLHVLVLVLLAGFVTEMIRGKSGHPWDLLCAVGGVTYIIATVTFSRRG
jgi:uncharacterized membrane protein